MTVQVKITRRNLVCKSERIERERERESESESRGKSGGLTR